MELAVPRPTHIRIQGPDGGSTLVALPLDGPLTACVVGSGPNADIRIDNPSVSEQQCRIATAGEGLTIEPLDPQWTTFVNGVPIARAVALCDGDHVDFGDVTLEAIIKSPAADPAPLTPRRAASLTASQPRTPSRAAAIRAAKTPAPVPSTRAHAGSRSSGKNQSPSRSSVNANQDRSATEPPISSAPTPQLTTDLDRAVLDHVRSLGRQYGFNDEEHVHALAEIIIALDDDLSGLDTKYPEVWYTLTNTAQSVESRLRRARTQVERLLSKRAAAQAAEQPVQPAPPPQPSLRPTARTQHHEVTQPSPRPAPSEPVSTDSQGPPDLAGFEILDEIGRGGMGAVYRARNTRLDIDVAVKVMRSLDSGDRLLQEARAAAKLQHPNIVQVLQFERVGNTGYYVMQLVRGLDGHRAIDRLRDELVDAMTADALCRRLRIDPPGASPEFRVALASQTPYYAAVAVWIAGAADGLDYAHRSGIVHRDVKPSNLMIAPDGRMMVMDFGLAVPAHAQGEAGEGRVGTPRYLAPERVADWAARSGLSDNDPRADIWSLGVTMYEFLTLRPAYQGAEEIVLRGIATSDPPPPTSLAWSVPPELERICQKAMRRSPEERYVRAGDMASDLRTWLSSTRSTAESRLPKTAMDWLRFVSPKREK